MRVFATQENWEARQNPKQKTKTDSANTVHHEPEKRELKRLGLMSRIKEAEMPIDHATHAAIHYIKFQKTGDEGEWNAYGGQASQMDERESDKLERILDSAEEMSKLEEMIRKQRKRFNLEW